MKGRGRLMIIARSGMLPTDWRVGPYIELQVGS
jgi:hypothetical protein